MQFLEHLDENGTERGTFGDNRTLNEVTEPVVVSYGRKFEMRRILTHEVRQRGLRREERIGAAGTYGKKRSRLSFKTHHLDGGFPFLHAGSRL